MPTLPPTTGVTGSIIEDTDLETKSTFMLLRQLFDLQAGQTNPQVPALTLPVR